MSLPTVTILGSGFGGIYTAKLLLKKGFQVCLVSDQDCFTFTPLLHQVAVGTLLPYNIGLDNKNFLKNKNLTIIKNKVIKVDFKTKSIILQNNKTLTYDFLVIATGARAKRQTQTTEQIFYLKNLTDALAIKEKLKALIDLKKPITLNVIGAGFTGLEIIFEINSFLKNNSPDLFTLNLFSQNGLPLAKDDKLLGNYLRKKITQANINFYDHHPIDKITTNKIYSLGQVFPTDLTISATGITLNTELIDDEFKDEKLNLIVTEKLTVIGQDKVFALGDIIFINKQGKPPMIAQLAIRQASLVARNICQLEKNKPLYVYKIKSLGILLSLGKFCATGRIYGWPLFGFTGWLVWHLTYLLKIPGIKNKGRILRRWVF